MSEINELSLELLGNAGMNPWDGNDSSARKVMANTHMGQAPFIKGVESRRFFTGMEHRFGEFTFDVSFPTDCKVIHIFDKYKCGIGADAVKHNPTRYIIYEEDNASRRLGVLELPEFKSYHKDFGFPMKTRSKAMQKLRQIHDPNYPQHFEEGEIVASSPALKDNGEYGIGVNAAVAAMSVPSGIEDGFMIRRGFLRKLGSVGYHKCVADFGKRFVLLNLYGDINNYKPFPDIGERIRPDGMVFAMREIDNTTSMMDMTPAALMRFDAQYDKPIFGEPNARVADITVWHDEQGRKKSHPTGLDAQARKYYEAGKVLHEDLLRMFFREYNRRNKNLHLTHELSQLIYEAQVYLPERDGKAVVRSHKLDRLDEWRVEITYEYDIDITIGYKLTDIHGKLTLPAYSVMSK